MDKIQDSAACHDEGHRRHDTNPVVTSAKATLHCLTGCVIGEVAGLIIAMALGLGIWPTILLATSLAYLSGFTLGLLPVIRDQGKSFIQALKLIWLGEFISIGVMEFAMNSTDYYMGGMTAGSLLAPQFWIAMMVAIPAGFIAAWPVNWWLLRRDLKACH